MRAIICDRCNAHTDEAKYCYLRVRQSGKLVNADKSLRINKDLCAKCTGELKQFLNGKAEQAATGRSVGAS